MILKTLSGKTISLEDADIKTLSMDISSPRIANKFSSLDFMQGKYYTGGFYEPRNIECKFLMEASARDTFSLLRDEIFQIFGSLEPFYIIDSRQKGKLWLVRLNESFFIPQNNVYGVFEVDFLAFEGVAKSVKTTLQLEKQGIINDDTWGFGMGLETVDDTELIYTHTGKTFKIFNAGNVSVHPFANHLKIQISKVTGATKEFTLVNRTNNSKFKVTRELLQGDVLVIDGPVIKLNSTNAAKDTTKEFIELSPGWNNFEILGASSATVSFDFNFIYL